MHGKERKIVVDVCNITPVSFTKDVEMFVMFCSHLQKLELVNGVLFTGGWAKSGLYFETVTKIFKVSIYLFLMLIKWLIWMQVSE